MASIAKMSKRDAVGVDAFYDLLDRQIIPGVFLYLGTKAERGSRVV
jgi:hypothetical protein